METVPQFYTQTANEHWITSAVADDMLIVIELTPDGMGLLLHAASHLLGDTFFANDPAECVKALMMEVMGYAAWEQMFYGDRVQRSTSLS